MRAAGQILERDATLGNFVRAQHQHSLHLHAVSEFELFGQLGCLGVAGDINTGYAQLRGQFKRLRLQLRREDRDEHGCRGGGKRRDEAQFLQHQADDHIPHRKADPGERLTAHIP